MKDCLAVEVPNTVRKSEHCFAEKEKGQKEQEGEGGNRLSLLLLFAPLPEKKN